MVRKVVHKLAARVVRVPHDGDVVMEVLESMLRMSDTPPQQQTRTLVCFEPSDMDAVTYDVSSDCAAPTHLLVDLDVDQHALLGLALEQSVQAPLGVVGSGPT